MRLLRGKFIFFEDKQVLMISFVIDADSAETRQKKEGGWGREVFQGLSCYEGFCVSAVKVRY
jgi:hypothetical protein